MAFDTRLLANLNVLAAVVQAGNFRRAGELLGLSQPAVSRAIQRLEERLTIRLFERSATATRLTEEGRRFCQEMLPALTRLEEVVEGTVRHSSDVRGRLRINVEPAFARLALAPKLAIFLQTHPGLHVELVARDHLGDLVADGFDASIRFGQQESSTLSSCRVFEVRVVTCASPEYLKRRGKPRHPTDLAKDKHECLLFRNSVTGLPFSWDFIRGKKRLPSLAVSGRLTVNDDQTYREACLAGMGVAQLLHLGLEPLFQEGKLIDLFPDWPDEYFPLWAYYPSRQCVSAKLRALLDFLQNLEGDGVGIRRSIQSDLPTSSGRQRISAPKRSPA